MNVFGLEEFSSRRRAAQARVEEALRPLVQRALDTKTNTGGWDELLDEVAHQWQMTYQEETGNRTSGMPRSMRSELRDALQHTKKVDATDATVDRIAIWLATAILSHATMTAADDDPEELFVEWVSMEDSHVRETHRHTAGQQRPIGEKFTVGDHKMPYPGYPGVPMELWINCRCTLRPVLASEVNNMTASDFRDVPPGERKKAAEDGNAMPDGSYPIANCGDLQNAVQAIGRAKDPEATKAHIKKRANALDCPDVTLPEGWAVQEVDPADGEVVQKDAPAPDPAEDPVPEDPTAEAPPVEQIAVPWHGVLAPEGVASGDGRGFKEGALSTRDLPLPLTWQKTSAEGHLQSVVVAKIEATAMVDGQMRGTGHYLTTPEADEAIGLVADFGKFGVSVDADSADFDFDEADSGDVIWFSKARVCGASQVPIPAFAEAWIALGEPPEGFMGDTSAPVDNEEPLVAAGMFWEQFVDVAPGVTEDGPGWLTHPVDTDRLRDYWTHGEGAAKIAWGAPGDFDRCRANLAQYVKPQYLNGYCANRHKDALGVWPGQEASMRDVMKETPMADSINLVAGGVPKYAPADWFKDPEFTPGDGRLVEYANGTYGCPMTITEDGQVFGHIATWKECHSSWGQSKCILAPHSATNYASFRLGCVLTDEGEVATGSLTIGAGHASIRATMAQAQEHYDNACAAWADINVGEDEYGIWFAGWVRPGTPEEMIHAARASKLSGDWRRSGSGSELCAVLAVNVPGFKVPRVAASIQRGEVYALVAAGALADPEQTETFASVDMASLAKAVVDEIEARQNRLMGWKEFTALAEGFSDSVMESRRAKIAALAAHVEEV